MNFRKKQALHRSVWVKQDAQSFGADAGCPEFAAVARDFSSVCENQPQIEARMSSIRLYRPRRRIAA